MVSLLYVGPFVDGVYIPMPDGSEILFTPGTSVEVPDDLAEGLLAQPDNFKRASGSKSAAKPAAEKEG
jgi:hypothetical protein